MPDIHIRRDHALGLAKARKIAGSWAGQVEKEFGLECTIVAGETGDTVGFRRSGVSGQLVVAADHFDLTARLGLLLGVFAKRIESEIEGKLDALLAAAPAKRAAAKKRKP